MKSRDEIVIIMLQWMRLYTLGRRGSQEFKTFLKTRLISSRVDQKLRTKMGEYTGFQEEIGPNSWVIGAIVEQFARVVGAVPLGEDVASIPPRFLTGFSGPSASNRLQIWPRSHHNRATIAPRSGHDRVSIVILELGRPPSDHVGSIPRQNLCDRGLIASRSRLDRGSIGPRSWGSSTTILCRPMEIQRSGEFHALP